MNHANKMTGQSLSDFQTGIGAAAHATLDIEQLILMLELPLFTQLPLRRAMMVECLQP